MSVLDALDQVRAQTAMAAWAIQHKVSRIAVGAAGGKRMAHKVDIDDLSLVTHDPLLAQLRYRLRKDHGAIRQGKIGLACVFSREPVKRPTIESVVNHAENDLRRSLEPELVSTVHIDGSLNCHGYGSVVSVTSTFGMCAAGWALDKIAG